MKKSEKNKLKAILCVIAALAVCFALSRISQNMTYSSNEKDLAAALRKSAVEQICIVPSGAIKQDMAIGNFYTVVDGHHIDLGKSWRGPVGDKDLAVALFLKSDKVYKTLIVKNSAVVPYLGNKDEKKNEKKDAGCLIPAEREG